MTGFKPTASRFRPTKPALAVALLTGMSGVSHGASLMETASSTNSWVLAGGLAGALALLWRSRRAIGRLRRERHALVALSERDALTGLPNRRGLDRLLEEAFADGGGAAHTGSLVFFDLDHFKRVNDLLGHKTGDLLLRAVAHRLNALIPEQATLCRMGGDEFALYCAAPPAGNSMRALVHHLVTQCAQPFVLDGTQVHTAASMGLAYVKDCANASDLLSFADQAMYAAKACGRGRLFEFGPAQISAARRHHQLRMDLAGALEAGQVSLVLEPLLPCQKNGPARAHLALQWAHPSAGLIDDSELRALVAAQPQAQLLCHWQLETLIEYLGHPRGSTQAWVAVLLTEAELMQPLFIGRLKQLLDRHGVTGSRLQFDLSAQTLSTSLKNAPQVLHKLRQLGVRLALLEAELAPLSLSTAQHAELSTLCMGPSVVHQLTTERGRQLCRALLSQAHALGLHTSAYGVRTPEEGELLRSLGCDDLALARQAPPSRPLPLVQELPATWTQTNPGPSQ